MIHRILTMYVALVLMCLSLSCREGEHSPSDKSVVRTQTAIGNVPPSLDVRTPEQVVEEFGRRMKLVPTSASTTTAANAIRENYGEYVHPRLVEIWANSPAQAPGRQVSSPWPDRIEISSSSPHGRGVTVRGTLVEATSTGDGPRLPIRAELERAGDQWLITAYEAESGEQSASLGTSGNVPDAQSQEDSREAIAVLRAYYQSVASKSFERAYGYWGSSGPPNQSLESFKNGFANTSAVELNTGTPSRVEAAAGSRYIEIPVTIVAKTTSGKTERFEGTYTLRRSVVDGASAAERKWHIYRASIRSIKSDPGA